MTPSLTQVEIPSAQPPSGPELACAGVAPQGTRWTKPILTVYGDVRQLTMGPTPSSGESGNPGTLLAS
ncbi:MAG: hypothetical protein ABIV06_10505 [Thermoanaerobaculia bacterium]